ncbi:histone-lysine N-methyltransferase 2B [Paramisgurnus dabryanus]|uniref:histone-lysine N-methyltransferase 2B n=1 Tax=Paramisgurnus dabryanus TaxID=90735 RepID=UPI0031F3961E
MAAAGGGLSASAAVASINTSATIRCRFPGRPWTSRSLLRTEKRSRVGRARAEDRKGPRPVDVGTTLREDPSLTRLLMLAEKHKRQSEAGFCSSGSDEEGDFTGFKVDRKRSSLSRKGSSSRTHKPGSSKVKPVSAAAGVRPAGKSSDKPKIKSGNDSKTDQTVMRPKMVIKITARRMTKKETEQHLRPSSSSKTNGRLLRRQRDPKGVSTCTEENKSEAAKDENVTETLQSHDSSGTESRRRQKKIVWTSTLVKGKQRASRVRSSKDQRSSTENAETLETNQHHKRRRKEIDVSEQAAIVSQNQKRISKSASLEADQEPVVSPDGAAGASLSKSLECSNRKKHFRKPRKSLFVRRKIQRVMLPKMQDSQGQASSMPRKRKRSSCTNSDSKGHMLQKEEVQDQPIGEMDKSSSAKPTKPVVTARSSRVIKVPKRFMDDASMSALPEKCSPKKPALTEIPMDTGKRNIELSQALESGVKQEPEILKTAEMSILEKAKSQVSKPVLSYARVAGAPRGMGGRGSQTMDYKIYWKLKKLTSSLAQRKMQRIASASNRLNGEGAVKTETEDMKESVESGRRRKSDSKTQDVYHPGVVPKLVIRVGEQSDQSALTSLAEGSDPVKENVEATSLEGTNEQTKPSADNTQMMMEPSGTTHRINLSGANKRMFHLLKRAKVQLIKIDQQKQLKSAQLLSGSARVRDGSLTVRKRGRRKAIVTTNAEVAPQERLIAGPRIKHVCRAAAVALGQPRAMIPDDIPRLSALPLHERDQITGSPATEDVASHSEPESEGSVEQKPTFRRKYDGLAFGRRLNRCLRCKGCNRLEDCGKCVFCLDKPKFGGPNKKRQSCVLKKCSRIERNKTRRFTKVQMNRQRPSAAADPYSSEEENEGDERKTGPFSPTRRQPRRQVTPQCYRKLLSYDSSDTESASSEKTKTSVTQKTQSSDVAASITAPEEAAKQKKQGAYRAFWAQSRMDKNSGDQTSSSVLAPMANGFTQRGKCSRGTTNKIRVDFKEDCNIQNVWLMGGLSILTSVPIMPQSVCLLCASKGEHDMIFCQMCCEPFHPFCLPPDDRPKEENKENWCCRRCKFCHVCGRKSRQAKPVLQCKRCMNCYHPACLGPTYPKPVKMDTSWICMPCIRCKSCGMTPGKSLDAAWNHNLDLCPDCTKLHSKGNFCTVCLKCYKEFDSSMMQCARCANWVHPRCEGLTDDLYEILSRLRGKSLVFSCAACSKRYCSGWQKVVQEVLRDGLQKIMTGLRNSPTTQHLFVCSQCKACPDLEIGKLQSVCCLHLVEQKLEKDLYASLKAFHEDVVTVMVDRLKNEEYYSEELKLTSQAKMNYIKVVQEVFCWFNSQDPKTWNSHMQELPSGMLPGAVIPPSDEHSYAQWLKTQDCTTVRPEEDQENLQSHGSQDMQKSNIQSFVDERQCSLCQQNGDAKPNDAGRLLYIGQNEWVHVNCCVWSAEVQEVKGALMHVHSAVTRGRFMRCERCGQAGATVGCCLSSCQSNYHFMCARISNCVFQTDKKVYCYKHRDLINNKIEQGNAFEVLRRVYVDFDGINLRRKFLTGLEPETINVMIGSLHVQKVGVLTELSANSDKLYPVGYQCSRWYWSTVDPRRQCRYTCKITEMRPSSRCKTGYSMVNQEENHTIVHSPRAHTDEDATDSEHFSPGLSPTTPPKTKQDSVSKTPGYPHSRRPAGGMFRPLPSPGNAVSTSHHILTISDLDETRRPTRRLSTRSRNASPPSAVLPGPMTLRSGGAVHPRSLSFSPPASPLGATENLVSFTPPRRRRRPPSLSRSNSTSSGPSPPKGALQTANSSWSIRQSPRLQQPSKIPLLKSTEVDQELISAHFDPDTDVAVASVLNAKLEFDEALLNENVALHCEGEDDAKEINEGADKDVTRPEDFCMRDMSTSEAQMGADSVDEDADNYLNFNRTVVVCEGAKNSSHVGLPVRPNSGSISQLDGADNDSESDTGEANAENDTQEVENSSISSRDTEPLKCTSPNKGRSLGNGQLVCTPSSPTSVENPCTADFIDQNAELEAMEQVCEEQEVHEETLLQESENLIVVSNADGSSQEEASITEGGLQDQKSSPTTTNSDLVTAQEDVLLDSESKEIFLDDVSGNFISAIEDRDLNAGGSGEICDSSSMISLNKDGSLLKGLSPASSVNNARNVAIKSIPPTKRRYVTIQPGMQANAFKMAMPVVSSMPYSVPVTVVSASPVISVNPHVTPLASPQVVINGFAAQPKETTRGRTIAIRIANPKQVTGQQGLTGSPSSPQVLLVNRAGQILVKNPQTNTYQIPNPNSPSYTQISQIAKILHSGNIIQRPVPKVTVIPVPQGSLGRSPTTRIISYNSNGATQATQVLIRSVRQPGDRTDGEPPKNVSPRESAQKEMAQAIIDKAMASHRETLSPTVTPYLNENLSTESCKAQSHLRGQPNILTSYRPLVRVKRVSSVTDRIGVKKCRTDFMDHPTSSSQDDLNRSNKVRIKTPSVKDVIDLDNPDVGSPKLPKHEAKFVEPERKTPDELETNRAQGRDTRDRSKSQQCMNSKHGDSSDWAPYAGWSSDEDSPSPGTRDKCFNQYQPRLRFQITSDDGFFIEADSMDVAWKAVVDGVQEARIGFRMEHLPFTKVSGARVLGILHDAVLFLLEQLQGADLCQQHRFRFHHHENMEEELPINPSGCARAEVYERKSTFDMFNFLASQHRKLPESRPCDDEEDDVMLKSSRRATSTELPVAMRFRHLEKTSKEAVGVYRSDIHGRGLFCKRNIEAGEMVIEYAGNVIRSVLTDKREKYYDSKGIGCYMFRIDDFDVVDATMHGNAARFINHSCDPNCYSRVINVDGEKHIVIFALRKIYRGEELTYDYKFPIEDADSKLHCNCGARRCRRFLN